MSLRFLTLLCAALALTLAALPSEANTAKKTHKPKADHAKRDSGVASRVASRPTSEIC